MEFRIKQKKDNNSRIGAFSRLEISQSLNNLGEYITIVNNIGIGPYLSSHLGNHSTYIIYVSIIHQGVNTKGIKSN